MPPTNYRLLAAQQEPHKMPVPLTNAGEFCEGKKEEQTVSRNMTRQSKRTRLELLFNAGVRDPTTINFDSLSNGDGRYLTMVALEKCPAMVTLDSVSSEDEMSCV